MTDSLAGRRVLVLGTGGIGAAIAAIASEAGAEAVVAGRDIAKAQAIAGPLGGRAVAIDLSDEASVAAGLADAGPVDHLVSTASAAANGPVTDLLLEDVERAVRAKLTGAVLLAKHAAPTLPPHGSLTFFSGFVAWRPRANQAVMAMTNGGLAHLVAALAVELAPRRVNAIAPGIIDSGMWDRLGEGRDAFFASTASAIPAGRVGTPRDVAEAVLLLLTNSFVTGTVIHVDGGGRWA